MKTAAEVDQLIAQLHADGTPIQDAVWETAKACVGWPYTYGAEGRIATKDGVRVRTFDCQGYTEWCLGQFGIDIKAAGATSQWNDPTLWSAQGAIADGIPDDTLVCLFHRSKDEPNKMAHTGFGYKGQTCECQVGVQYFAQRKSKWQYWAIPRGIGGDVPVPTGKPTLRRGDKGVYVTLMQTELIQHGFPCGSTGADGQFGANTEKAVKAFQQASGLTADGICGKKTWAALENPSLETYTVHIPNRPLYEAEAIASQYPGAWMDKEGSGA